MQWPGKGGGKGCFYQGKRVSDYQCTIGTKVNESTCVGREMTRDLAISSPPAAVAVSPGTDFG